MAGSANLNVMMKVARKAGRGLVKDFGEVENLQVSSKGPGDFVSRADRQAEELIREELMEARPTYGFLGEEGSEIEGQDPTRRWIVDPLDGTTNFLHGVPHWAVSIALEHKGAIVAGVIYDAAKDEMFYAEKGFGAFMNDRRMRVSGRRDMNEALIGTGFALGARADYKAMFDELSRVMPVTAGIRREGAAALDMAYVAAGRYDAFWHRRLYPWDFAAGIIMIQEAGGFVGGIDADEDYLETGNIIAANGELFDRFAKLIRS